MGATTLTSITESQIKALGLTPDVEIAVVKIVEEALAEKEKKGRVDPIYFTRFWAQYPSREGPNPKAPAKLKFDRAVICGADPERIISAAIQYAKTVAMQTDRRFITQAVTWLNQRRYEDYEAPSPQHEEYKPLSDAPVEPAWAQARLLVAGELGGDVFRSWIDSLDLVEIAIPRVTLSAPTRFLKSYIEGHYMPALMRAFQPQGIQEVRLVVA